MNLKKKKFDIIQFNFTSFNKFSFKKKKFISKKLQKLLLLFWLLKKYKTTLKISLIGIKKYKKIFVLLSSPKCYKVGKRILEFQYYKYAVVLKKNIKKLHNLNNVNLYIKYYLELLKFFDTNYTTNNKIKFILNTLIF